MTIRPKILALFTVVLLLFGVTIGITVRLEKHANDRMGSIARYHLPLTALAGNIAGDATEYRLLLFRLLVSTEADSVAVRGLQRQQRQLRASVTSGVDKMDLVLSNAIADPKNTVNDRIAFADLKGRLRVMREKIQTVQLLIGRIFEAYAAGHADEGRAMSRSRVDGSVLADLNGVLLVLDQLAEQSVQGTADLGRTTRYLTILLFLISAIAGLGAAMLLATRIVFQLQRLVSNTRALQDGGAIEPMNVASSDEVGQLTHAFNHMVIELRAKEQIRETFGKFVDPKVVAQLTSGGGEHAAERRNVSICFSDIKGFSSLSEQLTPQVIVRLLNRHFTLAAQVIQAHDGIVDKYIGDAVMAYWAPPFVTDDAHPLKACLAALAQRDAMGMLQAELSDLTGMRRDVPELVVRMGIATGEVVLGTIGSQTAMSYTVIGDAVNLASRLESLNKAYGTTIIISEQTYKFIRHDFEARELDVVAVAGKSEPCRVYELLAPIGLLTPTQQQLNDAYAEGLARYRERQFDEADRCFERCLEIVPSDGAAHTLRARIADFRLAPPGDNWDGVWHALGK